MATTTIASSDWHSQIKCAMEANCVVGNQCECLRMHRNECQTRHTIRFGPKAGRFHSIRHYTLHSVILYLLNKSHQRNSFKSAMVCLIELHLTGNNRSVLSECTFSVCPSSVHDALLLSMGTSENCGAPAKIFCSCSVSTTDSIPLKSRFST